jgi:hypothetical protein
MDFYILRPVGGIMFGRQFAYADIVDPQVNGDNFDRARCPKCGEGLGMRPWLPPHRIELSSKRYPDFLWGAGFEIMLSDRFLKLYQESELTGITRIYPPAEIVRVGRKPVESVQPPPPAYSYVWYSYEGADLDDRASGARRPRGLCPHCRRSITALERIRFKDGSWSGADIFEAYGLPGSIVVTGRLKSVVDANGLLNADLIPCEDYFFDWDDPHKPGQRRGIRAS